MTKKWHKELKKKADEQLENLNEYGKKKELANTFANEHGINPQTVASYLYRKLEDWQNGEGEEMNDTATDNDIDTTATTTNLADTLKTVRNYQKEYEEGEIIEVRVVDIRDYGALVSTIEGDTKGLVHLSNICKEYVEDPYNYFDMGDIIEAEVLKFNKNKRELSLSTKDYFSKNKGKNDENDLSYNEEIVRQLNPFIKNMEKENGEMEEIITFLNGKIGMLSPEALKHLKALIMKEGTFKLGLILAKVLERFPIDFGVLLLKEVEEEFKNDINFTYEIHHHAVEQFRLRHSEESEGKSDNEIKELIREKCLKGSVLLEFNTIKYIKHDEIFFPAVSINGSKTDWMVKSSLTWEMVKDDMQQVASKYLKEA